jgi:hypothetical protein
MRRSRLVTILGGALLAAFLLPGTAVAADPAPTTVIPAPQITLHCAEVIPAGHPERERIVCRWNALTGIDVKVYRLWRVTDAPLGHDRIKIAEVPPDQPLRAVDRTVKLGHRYSYQVVAIGMDLKRVGNSQVVSVRVGRPAQQLDLKCVYLIDATTQGVWCHWSKSTRPAAVRYVLFRSVDGAEREGIYRTGIHGRRSFLDTHVKAGQVIRYKVLAVAADGRIVGVGGPERIVVPTVTFPV